MTHLSRPREAPKSKVKNKKVDGASFMISIASQRLHHPLTSFATWRKSPNVFDIQAFMNKFAFVFASFTFSSAVVHCAHLRNESLCLKLLAWLNDVFYIEYVHRQRTLSKLIIILFIMNIGFWPKELQDRMGLYCIGTLFIAPAMSIQSKPNVYNVYL